MAAGMLLVAVADGAVAPPPRIEAIPAPAPAARSATRRTRPPAAVASLVASPEVALSARAILTRRGWAGRPGRPGGGVWCRWSRRGATPGRLVRHGRRGRWWRPGRRGGGAP